MQPGQEETEAQTEPASSTTAETPKEKLQRYFRRKLDEKDKGLIDNETLVGIVGKIHDAFRNLNERDSLLTNFLNQGSFPKAVERELEIIKRYKLGGAYLLIDVDNFKEINDKFGHGVGDQVLKAIGEIISKGTRSTDILGHLQKESPTQTNKSTTKKGRIGGDEMAVLLTGADEDGSIIVAERLREKVPNILSGIIPDYSGEQTISISVGIATITDDNDTAESLKKRADEAMYRAKEQGRNQVVIFEEDKMELKST